MKTPEQQAVAEQQSFKVAQTTQALPAPAGNGPGTKITANASGVVVLPSDAKIATIQASGGDLRIVLEDGRVFIVEGGVANPPSIQIDGQTILGSSLASVFGPIQEVQPAAGDASPPSSGSNFSTPTGSIDQAFQISGLLGTDAANASGDGDDDSETPFFDDVPVVNAQTAFTIDEDGIDGQSSEGTSGYTGQLDIAYGVNGANLIAPITFNPTTLTGFTSGGDPVVFTWDQASLTLTGSVNGNPVFVLQVTDPLTGAFTATLSGPFDHNGAGRDGLPVSLPFVVRDGNGTETPGVLSLTVNDDVPVAQDISGAMNENDAPIIVAVEGLGADFYAGADGLGSISLDTANATIVGPEGIVLSIPGLALVPASSTQFELAITPGSAFDVLAAGETATLTIPYVVVDGDGDSVTGNFIVTITGQNDGPVAVAVAGAASEDGPSIRVTANFSDIDVSDTHTFTVNAAETQGAVTNNNDGTFTYVANGAYEYLAAGETATDTFTYTVTDNNGASSTATVTITITGQNDGPVALAVAGGANEDGPSVTVSANYSDLDASDTHTFTVNTTVTQGSVTNNSDGTFTYSPNAAFEALAAGETATDTFTYTVTDNNGASSTATVTITITGQNDGPVALAVAGGANEDGPSVLVTADYSDLDTSDTHTFTVNTTGTQGSVTNNNNGTFSYAANGAYEYLAAGETATDTFTYTVDDGNGGSSTATVTITITGQNDGPVALAVAGGANEDGPSVTVSANYSDLDA
ncbi:MAG TPA: Ig-like domain-containing protein, partial [Xanthobacteraceae bacterium]|nr:Ig-like domain-containing protein [Xanthobacteraceae bacterium]